MILILDFGSQYTQVIARKIRESHVYCEIFPGNKKLDEIENLSTVEAIILSGGPASVYEKDAPKPDSKVWQMNVPILGICYGMQLIAQQLGGKVQHSKNREYGLADIVIKSKSLLYAGLKNKMPVWMSHGDKLTKLPKGFKVVASSKNCPNATIVNDKGTIYGVQFHPEVHHSPFGKQILDNFLFKVCKVKQDWTMKNYIKDEIARIKKQVGKGKVLCALSGGVDSSVAAIMMHKAIGKQLVSVYVDHGLQKLGETERVRKIFGKKFGKNLIIVDAKKLFLNKLKGVTEP